MIALLKKEAFLIMIVEALSTPQKGYAESGKKSVQGVVLKHHPEYSNH